MVCEVGEVVEFGKLGQNMGVVGFGKVVRLLRLMRLVRLLIMLMLVS